MPESTSSPQEPIPEQGLKGWSPWDKTGVGWTETENTQMILFCLSWFYGLRFIDFHLHLQPDWFGMVGEQANQTNRFLAASLEYSLPFAFILVGLPMGLFIMLGLPKVVNLAGSIVQRDFDRKCGNYIMGNFFVNGIFWGFVSTVDKVITGRWLAPDNIGTFSIRGLFAGTAILITIYLLADGIRILYQSVKGEPWRFMAIGALCLIGVSIGGSLAICATYFLLDLVFPIL
jgi:hypothetical protein